LRKRLDSENLLDPPQTLGKTKIVNRLCSPS